MHRIIFPFLMLLVACAGQHPTATPYPPERPAAEATVAIDDLLAEAEASDKLAMLVLGANWCHDSRDFARMIERPELAEWLDQYYVIGLFNLGYLDDMHTYLDPFDVPVLYGTPTVLVVDPGTRRLLNSQMHYYWRNASQLDAGDARNYFAVYLSPAASPASPSTNLSEALARIDQFETDQAQRIYRAYSILGPMLAQYEQGNPPSDFDEKWSSLARMRSHITGDLENLRQSAREQDAEGVDPVELKFPEYPLFID